MDSATFSTSHCPNGSWVQGLRAGRWCCCWLVVNFARHHICKCYKAWVLSSCQLKKKCSTDYNESLSIFVHNQKKWVYSKLLATNPLRHWEASTLLSLSQAYMLLREPEAIQSKHGKYEGKHIETGLTFDGFFWSSIGISGISMNSLYSNKHQPEHGLWLKS